MTPAVLAAPEAVASDAAGVEIPTHWYNLLADLPFPIPPDLPPRERAGGGAAFRPQVPLELVRQSLSKQPLVVIPEPIRELYALWRPTPLRRAARLEAALGTPARIYYKYEGVNVSGSHKLNTAVAQAYYYQRAGVKRLTTGTGAGQWGTALAVACHLFGLECKVYMVGTSYRQKPYRKVAMQMFGAQVASSPSPQTQAGRELLARDPDGHGNLALAIAEALEEALSRDDTRFCIGSGEPYSILHQTVMGEEARQQLAALGEQPDVVLGSLGAGSNFGGIAFPFLRGNLAGESSVRCVSVEPAACPKLTRGVYAYDYTDSSGITPLEKMYTLGHSFAPTDIHAGGLRYHACSKLISALRHHDLIEAVAYQQTEVFRSGLLFGQTEGIVPAPESAHAVHGAVVEALRAKEEGTSPAILICLSGHGYFDMSAYEAFMDGRLKDVQVTDEEIARSLAELPVVDE
ncbi:MAG TPA: TrpB-like pyridoxal phosphate-dependent enzyme [Longimicrobium sp.]|nr:TrpB-like pyridoxal phosphate-dependent enzyme [Longimicrobium sp.]